MRSNSNLQRRVITSIRWLDVYKRQIVVRAKVEINQTKTGQQIIVKELPYEVIKCNLVRKIDDIRLNKKIDGIIDVRDESDRNGLRVAIDLKKEANAEPVSYTHLDDGLSA